MIFPKAVMKFLLPSLLFLKPTSAFHAHLPRRIEGIVLSHTLGSSSNGVFRNSLKHQTLHRFSSTSSDEETATEEKQKNAPRHDVRGSAGAPKDIDPEELKIQAALAEHQQNAPKLGFPVDGKL